METGREGWRQGGKDGDREGRMETGREGWRQGGKDGDREGKMETGRERWRQRGKDGDREGRMETDREGWRQGVREYWAVRRGVSAEPSSPFVVVGAGYVLVVVVVRCRRPLALSSFGVVRWRCHGRWRRPWALASSVGIVIGVGVVRGHRHWRWRRPWALASSVGIGVIRGRWRRPLALASSVGVLGVVR